MGSHRADRRASPAPVSPVDRAPESDIASPIELPTISTEIPVVRTAQPGKRRAAAKPRMGVVGLLPSMRAAAGVTMLAVAAGGVVTTPDLNPASVTSQIAAPSPFTGTNAVGSVAQGGDRAEVISRDSDRQTAEAAVGGVKKEAERQAAQRNAKLGELARAAEKEAGEIKKNGWVLPLSSYRLTARFGQSSGLWASTHTGLDFAAPSGSPIYAVSGGTVSSTGYEGSYGNQTVITGEDGTEIWYNHQTSFAVSPGDVVRAGEVIGSVGSTGNSTGPHLHLEVRPGGGDPVDPYAALVANGLQP